MHTIGELIERNARNYPDDTAYVMGEKRVSYKLYAERVRRLASSFERLGTKRQDRIGIFSTNNVEYFEVYGTCEWAGFICALYNFRSAPPEAAWLLLDSAPHVVVFEAQFSQMFASLRKQTPDIAHYVCIGDECPDWAIAFETLISAGDRSGGRFRARFDDEVYLFYTSGTTGRAKGVPYNHRAALESARFQGRSIGPDMRVLQVTPAFHVGGKGFPLGALWMAGTVVLQRNFDPLGFLQLIQAEQITFTFMVVPMIQAVLDHPQFSQYNISSLRQIMSASAAIPMPLLRRAIKKMGPVFFISYGATELGTVCVLERHELKPDGNERERSLLGSVGHFVPEVDAVILNAMGAVCQANEIGEICIKSPIFHGYWNNSTATIEATHDGYFHSGDMGYADEEGFVFLVDRKKDMIISGGENIYSREVEQALYHHQAVAEAAVIGIPDAKWGEAVLAIVVLHEQHQVSEADLRTFCQSQIARYKCPKSIMIVESLPKTGTGKINKPALRDIYQDIAQHTSSISH